MSDVEVTRALEHLENSNAPYGPHYYVYRWTGDTWCDVDQQTFYRLRTAINEACDGRYTWTKDGLLPVSVNFGLCPGHHFFVYMMRVPARAADELPTCFPYRIFICENGNVAFETPFDEKEWKELCFLGNHPADLLTPEQLRRCDELKAKEMKFHTPPVEAIIALIEKCPDMVPAIENWFPKDISFEKWGAPNE